MQEEKIDAKNFRSQLSDTEPPLGIIVIRRQFDRIFRKGLLLPAPQVSPIWKFE